MRYQIIDRGGDLEIRVWETGEHAGSWWRRRWPQAGRVAVDFLDRGWADARESVVT